MDAIKEDIDKIAKPRPIPHGYLLPLEVPRPITKAALRYKPTGTIYVLSIPNRGRGLPPKNMQISPAALHYKGNLFVLTYLFVIEIKMIT